MNEKLTNFKRPLLDYVRLSLALQVVWLHCWHSTWMPLYAVPCFIAVSGFCVLGSLDRSKTYGEFAWKRFLRVQPLLLVSLVVTAAIFGLPGLKQSSVAYLTMGMVGGATFGGTLWSVGAEDFLYCVMAAWHKLGVYARPWLVWVLFAASVVPMIHHYVPPTAAGRPWLLPSFLVGSLIYLHREQLAKVPSWLWLLLIPAPMLYHGLALSPTVDSAVILLIGAFGPQPKQGLKVDLSYSVYLVHPIILTLLTPVLSGWALWWATCVIGVPICVACWFGIEKPFLALKTRRLLDQKANT